MSNEINLDSEGFDPINLERMSISEWIKLDSESNVVLVFRKEIYLINASVSDGVLSEKLYVECGEDNEPILDKNTKTGEDLFGIYYDLKDIGIPDLICENDNWEKTIMNNVDSKFFIIEEDKDYPTIRITNIDINQCEASKLVTVGIISEIEILPSTLLPTAIGGTRKKKVRRSKTKGKSKKVNIRKTKKRNKKAKIRKTKKVN